MQQKKPLHGAARKKKRSVADPKKATQRTSGRTKAGEKTPAATARRSRSAAPRLLEDSDDLPVMYDETRVVLTVVDPHFVNVRWDLNPRQVSRVKHASARGGRSSHAVARFNEVSASTFADAHVRSSFDVEIDLGAGNWYVPLWSADRAYFVDLGFKTGEGTFYLLARSNTAEVPPSGPHEHDDAHLAIVIEEDGLVEAFEVPPTAPFPLSLPAAPESDDRALPLTAAGPGRSVTPSLATRRTGYGGRRAIGIEVLWAVPEEVDLTFLEETVQVPEFSIAIDLAARAEDLFTPGVSS